MKARAIISLLLFASALLTSAQNDAPLEYSLSFSQSENARTFDPFFRIEANEGFSATMPGLLELRKSEGVGNGSVSYGATFQMSGDFWTSAGILQIGSLEGAEAGLTVVFANGVFRIFMVPPWVKAEIVGFRGLTRAEERPYSSGGLSLRRVGHTLSAFVGDELLLSETGEFAGGVTAHLHLTQTGGHIGENRVGFVSFGLSMEFINPSLAIERREDGTTALRWLQQWDDRLELGMGAMGPNGTIE